MRLIISPAKKMRSDSDSFAVAAPPQFLEQAEELKTYLQTLDYDQCRALWRCNDAIAALNFERVRHMDLRRAQTPALFSYDGIPVSLHGAQCVLGTRAFLCAGTSPHSVRVLRPAAPL